MDYECTNIKNYTDRERNSVLSIARADTCEWLCDMIEQFGTKVDVKGDRDFEYRAVMAAIKYIGRECKETVKEVRRDIWEFISNRKRYQKSLNKEGLDRIYVEKTEVYRMG